MKTVPVEYQSPLIDFPSGRILQGGEERARNILINHNGTLSAMPFDTGREGFWYFDGQVYYQKKNPA